jgi:hypothetical protein
MVDTVRRVVADYAGPSLNSTTYFFEDPVKLIFAAASVPLKQRERSRILAMARVDGDKVIVEVDITDRPVYEALRQAGIPDSQIVLAYEKAAPATD